MLIVFGLRIVTRDLQLFLNVSINPRAFTSLDDEKSGYHCEAAPMGKVDASLPLCIALLVLLGVHHHATTTRQTDAIAQLQASYARLQTTYAVSYTHLTLPTILLV